jgi:hypothetical protein
LREAIAFHQDFYYSVFHGFNDVGFVCFVKKIY